MEDEHIERTVIVRDPTDKEVEEMYKFLLTKKDGTPRETVFINLGTGEIWQMKPFQK